MAVSGATLLLRSKRRRCKWSQATNKFARKVGEIDKVDHDDFSLRSFRVDSMKDGFSFCHGGPACPCFKFFDCFYSAG